MPLYEYVCNDCHSHFDALVASRDRADDVACATCSGANTRRLISTFAFSGTDDLALKLAANTPQHKCCGGSCGCNRA